MLKFPFIFFTIYFYLNNLFSGLLLLIPLLTINNFVDNKIGCFFKNIYIINTNFVLLKLYDTKIFVNSNQLALEIIDNKNQIFLFQNHFSEIDFFLGSFLLINIKNLFRYKIITVQKKILSLILIGNGIFSLFSKDIYLNRNIEMDKNNLVLNNNANLIYIFPEGTVFNKNTKIKSDLYSKKNNLPIFKYHLYPRITGIETIYKYHPNYKKIYDLTILIDTIPKDQFIEKQSFIDFFYKYEFPKRIFICIQKYKLESNLNQLVENIFIEKDNFVKNFSTDQNKFIELKFINSNYIYSFLISNSIFITSIYLFLNYKFIKLLYFTEIILFIINYFIN